MSRRERKRRPSDTRPRPQIPIDVEDRNDEFVVTADLPGIRKQDVDVRVRKNRVQVVVDPDDIGGEEESGAGEGPNAGEGSFARLARERGPLSRTIRLPERVDERRTNAEYLNGSLRITLPKRNPGRSIEVE